MGFLNSTISATQKNGTPLQPHSPDLYAALKHTQKNGIRLHL
ncbi:hypothetical protein KNP414_07824 [Paenibacillus mucilaginosus KNP414]|uniref:Uncharacterized protein n=1 Tax=Paenibacillus mucilaginosus (strain KNP414) TaxID=1036673 RepID=F8FIT2_PAEMK|nr:hypothetical protein KNP414_07824 [Paenibacillus mucilaginosus KNP414]